MTEFCGVLGRALGASRRYDGPMGKSDRALLVGALGLFTALIPSVVPAWPWVLWLGTVLTGITCLHRLARAFKEIHRDDSRHDPRLSPIWQMGVVILCVLVVSTIVIAALRLLQPKKNYAELLHRTISWWVMASVFFGAVAVNDRIGLVLFAFLSFWAMKEYVTLLKTRPADHAGLVWTFLAIPIQYYWIAIGWYGMFVIFIPVYVFLILPVRLMLSRETAGFVASASQIQWGLMAFVFGLSHLGFLLIDPHRRSGAKRMAGRCCCFLSSSRKSAMSCSMSGERRSDGTRSSRR